MSRNSITLNVLADITKKINVDNSYRGDRKALIVFTGSRMDLSSRIEEINRLREDGIGFDLAFSFMSENIVDREKLVAKLKPDQVYGEEDIFDLESIETRYSYLIGPNITMNTLAKVATGMVDSFVATIIWTFLYKGKKVFLDYGAVKNYLGKKCQNKAIDRMIENNIASLADMGAVELTEGTYFDRIAEKKEILDIDDPSLEKALEVKDIGKNRVITATDIEQLSKNKTLLLEKGDIITPLAKDRARQMDVEIKINR